MDIFLHVAPYILSMLLTAITGALVYEWLDVFREASLTKLANDYNEKMGPLGGGSAVIEWDEVEQAVNIRWVDAPRTGDN